MSRLAIAGVLLCLLGCVVLGFQAIASVMGPKAVYKNTLVIDLVAPSFIDEMDAVSWHGYQDAADYVLAIPIYIICFVAGGILLIASSFFWRQ